MSMTSREIWVTLHGMAFGAIYLLVYSGGLVGLWNLRPGVLTPNGLKERLRLLSFLSALMAAVAWLTVITGAFLAYPWYRALPPKGADLKDYPQALLKAAPATAQWHFFGMEWKEHIAWIAPILATAVAYIIARYGSQLVNDPKLRRGVIVLFTVAFCAAAVAGGFGAFITKAAPIR